MKLLSVLSLLVLSSNAFADLKMTDHCYKLPAELGGGTARIRARYFAEKDHNGIYALADLLTVEALEGAIFEGSNVDTTPESMREFKVLFPSTIQLAESKQFLLSDRTLVESVQFVAVRKALGGSTDASDLNRMIKEETGIAPGRPVLRVVADGETRIEVVGTECK